MDNQNLSYYSHRIKGELGERERERNLFLYRKSIYKIQNNLTKHKINKYNDFLMRGSKKTMLPAQ